MELGVITLRSAASFRNQADLISKAARENGIITTDHTISEVCVGPPKFKWDKFIAFIPLWPRYLYDILRLTAFSARAHTIYGPVDGPFQLNVNFFGILKNLRLATPSQWCKDRIEQGPPATGCKVAGVFPHAIDPDVFAFSKAEIQEQRNKWLPASSERVVFFANLNPLSRKGFPQLVQAIRSLQKRLGDKFILVLHTGKKTALNFAPDLARTPNIIIEDQYNTLPFRRIALKYVASDVYVHPSLQEGFGLPILEAIASGKAVICVDAGAMNEIVSPKEAWMISVSEVKKEKWKNGAIAWLHQYNPGELADCMELAITDPEARKEKSEAALERSKDFNYQDVYTKLVKF